MAYSLGVFGLPGSGKSTIALSHPGTLLHWIFGSSEETTQLNFTGRADMETVKFNWMDTLKPENQAKFLINPLTTESFEPLEQEKACLAQKARAKNIASCWYLVRQLRADRKAGKRQEVQSVVLDNVTPFSEEFEDWVQVVLKNAVFDKTGELKGQSYWPIYQAELMGFLREFCSLTDYGIHAVFTCHIGMNLSEEVAATTRFFDQADPKKPIVPKEWQPLITGKARLRIAGIPDYALFTEVETPAGLPTKFIARLEPNQSNVGIGKPRRQPYKKPREIEYTKNHFYDEFNEALEAYLKTGQPV